MTIGELARRTSLSIKAIRQYEALGLIYSAGRSDSNYQRFDESVAFSTPSAPTGRFGDCRPPVRPVTSVTVRAIVAV
jgi:hypothetical protein